MGYIKSSHTKNYCEFYVVYLGYHGDGCKIHKHTDCIVSNNTIYFKTDVHEAAIISEVRIYQKNNWEYYRMIKCRININPGVNDIEVEL